MPELAFIMSARQDWFLWEFAETLRYELDQQDLPSTVHTDGFPEPRPDRVYVLLAPQHYLALEGEQALPDDAILKRTIFLCAEPPSAIDLELLRRAGAVFDIDLRSVALLRRAGIPARHLRPGYSMLRDRFDPEAERAIDVMFLGAHTRLRTEQLARCAPVLAQHNCLLQISDDSYPNATGSSSFLAEGKWDLLARTKILLNVHRGDDPYLEWLRVLDAIHAGAVVVTEHSSGIAPLVAGEHLIVAAAKSLQFVLDAALQDEDRLHRLRAQAYERIRSWLPFALSASVFRAAAVELVGRPVLPTASLGRRMPVPQDPWTLPRSNGDEQVKAMGQGLKGLGVDVIQLRREIARLELIVRSGTDASARTELVHETRTGPAPHVPQVTVVTALYNRAEVIQPTLDSLARSPFRDLELLVVDDGSTDGSADAAREWMRTHPRTEARLVSHAVNRGLGAARNIAMEWARAPYCLILDAGDEVYPRCLEVLVGTLNGIPEAAFAYPVLEVFGMTDTFAASGGDYLLNVFGWEPGRLRLWTRVPGLALIRSDRLRELGGFATDPEISGWEDNDLWCRVAERGWHGQLVPQILGRYRATSASVGGTANALGTAPVNALIERAPRLMAGVVAPS